MVALSGKFVLSTEEVLKLAEEGEAETARKKARKKQRKRKVANAIEVWEVEVSVEVSCESGSDCIVVGLRN